MIIPNVSYCENDDIVKYSSDEILMTTETNPEVLAICYARGWCANNRYMTFEEAAKVKDIVQAFRGKTITHFEELKYFSGITNIPSQAFQNCEKLVSVELPNTITTIESYAFYVCRGLSSIVIPSSVTHIGINAFRATSLRNIISLSMIAPTITGQPFHDVPINGTLYAPSGATGYETWMASELTHYGWAMIEI